MWGGGYTCKKRGQDVLERRTMGSSQAIMEMVARKRKMETGMLLYEW